MLEAVQLHQGIAVAGVKRHGQCAVVTVGEVLARRSFELVLEPRPHGGRPEVQLEQALFTEMRLCDRRQHPGGGEGRPPTEAVIGEQDAGAGLARPPSAGEADDASADDYEVR